MTPSTMATKKLSLHDPSRTVRNIEVLQTKFIAFTPSYHFSKALMIAIHYDLAINTSQSLQRRAFRSEDISYSDVNVLERTLKC
jgi:hypothetical protein